MYNIFVKLEFALIIDGEQVMYDIIYGQSPLSVTYFNELVCPTDIDITSLFDNCTTNRISNDSCYSTDYVVRCFNDSTGIIVSYTMYTSVTSTACTLIYAHIFMSYSNSTCDNTRPNEPVHSQRLLSEFHMFSHWLS